jgi:hypothetical protein
MYSCKIARLQRQTRGGSIMRRTALLLAAGIVLALTAAPAAFAQANDQNCDDFASQAEAQAHLDADPSDPDGLDALPGPADGNDDPDAGGHGDGQACESFNYGAPDGGTTPQPGDGEELPFTGPGNDTLLPVGTVLLGLGLLVVGTTRYRGRHAQR